MRTVRRAIAARIAVVSVQYATVLVISMTVAAIVAHRVNEAVVTRFEAIAAALKRLDF